MNVKARQKLDLWLGAPLIMVLKPLVVLFGWMLRRDHSIEVRSDLVFLKFQGGGSLLIALPALLGLRQRYRDKRFRLVTTPSVRPFASSLGVFDDIVVVEDRSLFSLIGSGMRALRSVFRCDTVVDLEVYSFLSAIFGLLTLARNRIGYYLESTFWRRNVFTHLVFFNRFSGTYFFYEDIATRLGAVVPTHDECNRHLRGVNQIKDRQEATPRKISIGHGCSGFAEERRLSAPHWRAALAEYLRPGTELVFLGGKEEFAQAHEIIEQLKRASDSFVEVSFRNECGSHSLSGSLHLLAASDLFIGVDSGLLHFARALGIPSVSYWGPTDPSTRLKPAPSLRESIHYRKIPCSPCVHVAEDPPCRGKNICIQALFEPGLEKQPGIHSFMVK